MESENKFIERVNEVIADFNKEVKTAKGRKAVIVIASEPVNDGESRQTGAALGNELELVYALAGFIKTPVGRDLLKKAVVINMSSIISDTDNQNEQEENK